MTGILLPSPINGYSMPFFYAAIRSCWAFYAVDKVVADEMLSSTTGGDTGMEATVFTRDDGSTTALACLNFMHYPSLGSNFGSFTTELEFNAIAHPKSKAASVPPLSVKEFLYGQEQTKLVGYYRLHVVADSPIAIEAGRSVFGEYKYFGNFGYNVPTYNLTLADSNPGAILDWTFSPHIDGGKVYPAPGPKDPWPVAPNFTLTLQLSALQPDVQSSQTAVTDYSMWSDFTEEQVDPGKTPVPPIGDTLNGSRRNYLGAFMTYWIDESTAEHVQLTYGTNTNDLKLTAHMKALLGETADDQHPVAAAWIRSEPAVIESPAYYANKI